MAVKLNERGVEKARELIADRRFVIDDRHTAPTTTRSGAPPASWTSCSRPPAPVRRATQPLREGEDRAA
jgi:hypothetical protein